MRRRSGRRSQRHRGKAEQRRGRGRIRLRPQIVEERAVGGHQPAQLRRELGHRFHFVHARGLLYSRRGRIHLHAGVLFHAQVARGQKQNLLVGARRGGLGCVAHDQKRRAGLVPAGQIVEIRVLPVGHEVKLRFFRGEEHGHAAIQLGCQRHAPGVVHVGRLFFKCAEWRQCGGKEQAEQGQKHEATSFRYCRAWLSAAQRKSECEQHRSRAGPDAAVQPAQRALPEDAGAGLASGRSK